jgi:hypothetical protein
VFIVIDDRLAGFLGIGDPLRIAAAAMSLSSVIGNALRLRSAEL